MTWMWRCGKGPCIEIGLPGPLAEKQIQNQYRLLSTLGSVPVLHNCTLFFSVGAEYQYHRHKKDIWSHFGGMDGATNVEILQDMPFSCTEKSPERPVGE